MKITIPGTFTDLNTYINAERRNRFISAKIKKEETERVYWVCKELNIPAVTYYPVTICIYWYVPNKKKDPDNCSFSKKYLLDGIVQAGVLKGDGYGQIRAFIDHFRVDKENPRVEVIICQNGEV